MNLSDVFTAIAHKKLVAVDLPRTFSNQHELNGVSALRELFGTSNTTRGNIRWRYFADLAEPIQDDSEFTFYDARAKSNSRTGRTEWRFYYYSDFLARASIGDLLVFARTTTGTLFGLVFQSDSRWRRAAIALFRIRPVGTRFDTLDAKDLSTKDVELLQERILDDLGIEFESKPKPTDAEIVLAKFGEKFPFAKEMSDFARTQIEVDWSKSDEALIAWLTREEELFRALESVIIGKKLKQSFATVDEFIEYSLSVQNRRKSRMGLALQNHLSELFKRHSLRFDAQAKTEGNSRPDFLFPGQRAYADHNYDANLLVMLGAKSTSKDRWRQVLVEAARVQNKHLCTLEPGISEAQTNEMRRHHLTLVVPVRFHETYTVAQRNELLSVAGFIELVRNKQRHP